jgi:hypothetical protein
MAGASALRALRAQGRLPCPHPGQPRRGRPARRRCAPAGSHAPALRPSHCAGRPSHAAPPPTGARGSPLCGRRRRHPRRQRRLRLLRAAGGLEHAGAERAGLHVQKLPAAALPPGLRRKGAVGLEGLGGGGAGRIGLGWVGAAGGCRGRVCVAPAMPPAPASRGAARRGAARRGAARSQSAGAPSRRPPLRRRAGSS